MDAEQPVTEEARQHVIDAIRAEARKAGFPEYDVEGRLAGRVAGPPSDDRPDVPVWQYIEYAAAMRDITFEEVIQVRFPISFFGEGSTVTSIAEELQHGPPGPAEASVAPTAEDVVRRYLILHQAGVLGWNRATRTVERLKPLESEMEVFKVWWNELLDRAAYEGPRP